VITIFVVDHLQTLMGVFWDEYDKHGVDFRSGLYLEIRNFVSESRQPGSCANGVPFAQR